MFPYPLPLEPPSYPPYPTPLGHRKADLLVLCCCFPPANYFTFRCVYVLMLLSLWFILNTCFPSGSLELGMCQAEAAYQPAL